MRALAAKLVALLRPKYFGTYVVMLLAAAVMTILVATGTFDGAEKTKVGTFSDALVYSHGWPWEFMKSLVSTEDFQFDCKQTGYSSVPPWLQRCAWRLNGRKLPVDYLFLAVDLFVALAIIVCCGLTYRFWRNRRRHIWQFSLLDLFGCISIAGCCMGFIRYHQELHEMSAEAYRIADVEAALRMDEFTFSVLVPPFDGRSHSYLFGYGRPRDPEFTFCWPRHPSPAARKLLPSDRLDFFTQTREVCFNGDHLKERSHGDKLILDVFPKFPLAESAQIHNFAIDDSVIEALRQLPHLTSVNFSGTALELSNNEEKFSNLNGLPETRRRQIKQSQLAALARLKELPRLQSLLMAGDFDELVFKAIATIPRLRSLTILSATTTSPARGLDSVNLETLSDAHLYPALEELNVTIQDAANPSALSRLSHVKRLALDDNFNDAIIDAVCRMPALEEFTFHSYYYRGTDITVDVRKFAALQNLKRLTLDSRVQVMQADFDFLQAALPNTKIECQIVEVRQREIQALEDEAKSAKKVDD